MNPTTLPFKCLAFTLLSVLGAVRPVQAQCSGPTGLIAVGASGTYTTLTAALGSLSGGISGPVVLELQSDYTSTAETFPIVLNANTCFDAVNTLTIRPAANAAGLVISSANAGPTVDFNGAKYVTLDGTPGGDFAGNTISVTAAGAMNASNLNIVNTATTGVAIRMNGEASFNTIKFCDLQGRNTTGANLPTGMTGVVYIGNTGANGNDNNTIDHCNIHSTTTTNLPSIGIYVLGASNTGLNPNFNDNGTISNNHIYDFFLPGGNSAGIELTQGVHQWAITGNSLFQTATRTYTSGGFNRSIWVVPMRNTGSVGNGFTITNNYIGGSAPQCGGNTYTLTSFANSFSGIRLEVGDGGTSIPSSVQGNTIGNLAITSTITTSADLFHGIAILSSAGSVNVGTIEGNTVGVTTGNGAITLSGGSGSHSIGIFMSNAAGGSSTFNIRNNKLGAITLSATGNNFSGIYNNQAGTINIENNLLGSFVTPGSIQSISTSTASRFMRGINIPSGTATVSINNNTVANLSNATTATSGNAQSIGVFVGTTTPNVATVNGNAVFNLSCAAAQTGSGVSAVVGGIVVSSNATSPAVIAGNRIYALTATSSSTTAAIQIDGLYSGGTAPVRTIARNFVHSLDVTANNPAAILHGINIATGTGTIENNMVRLGLRPDGTSLTNAMAIQGIATGPGAGTLNLYHNSVYVGGDNVNAGTGTTAALASAAAAGNDDIRNNIFVNNRSNATSGASHYALSLTPSAAGASINYNLYRATGTNGVFAFDGAADVATYTAGWVASDMNSISSDPQFMNPAGDTSVVDLHINSAVPTPVEAAGAALVVADDIDGGDRSALSPIDIGADAGNFTSIPLAITLSGFYGTIASAANELYWHTATEATGDRFILERSEDGKQFYSIAALDAGGVPATYSFADRNPVPRAYYRLKFLKADGAYTYSTVVKLFREEGKWAGLTLSPNPAKGTLNLTLTGKGAHASLRITDAMGRCVAEMPVAGNTLKLDVSRFPKGMYVLRYRDDTQTSTLQFIKD